MIDIILEKNNSVVSRLCMEGNEKFLIRYDDEDRYKILGQVDNSSPTAYGKEDMPMLIFELKEIIKQEIPDNIKHINDILELCEMCMNGKGYIMIFTPFEY